MPTRRLVATCALSLFLALAISGCVSESNVAWPIWGATPGRTFCVPDMNLDKPPSPGWSAEVFGSAGQVLDVVADATTIYLAGQRADDARPELVALRLVDGKRLWRREVPDAKRVAQFGPLLALSGGKLCLTTEAGVLVVRPSDGRQVGRNDMLPCGQPDTFTLAGDRLIVHGNSDKLAAVRLSDGKVIWKADLDGSQTLVQSGGVVGALSFDLMTPSSPAAFSAAGAFLWRLESKGDDAGTGNTGGALGDNGLLIVTEAVTVEKSASMTGRLLAYDLRKGTQKWEVDMPTVPGFGLASDGRRLYVPSLSARERLDMTDGHLTCLDAATRRTVWTRPISRQAEAASNEAPGGFGSLPLVAGRTIIARINVTDLVGLDAATGKTLWRQTICKTWNMDHIILAGGRVIYTEAGRVATLIADGKGKTLLPLDVPPPATQPKQ